MAGGNGLRMRACLLRRGRASKLGNRVGRISILVGKN